MMVSKPSGVGVAGDGHGAAFVGGVDDAVERFGGFLTAGSMPMSTTTMISTEQIRATVRATDPSALAWAAR